MSAPGPDEREWLRIGLRAADQQGRARKDAPDPELLWRAYQGELPAAQAVDVIDAAAREPGGHEELALLVALHDELGATGTPKEAPTSRGWMIAAVAIAAALLVWVLRPADPSTEVELGDAEYRSGQPDILRSLVPSDAALPADAFDLRWEGLSGECTYRLRASTAELEVLFDRGGLDEPAVRIPATALADAPSGAIILWQAEVRCEDGRTGRSATHKARVK